MIRGFVPALRSELFRFRRSRALPVVLVLPGSASFLRVALGRLGELRSQIQEQFEGGGGSAPPSSNAYGPLVDGLGVGLIVAGFIILVIAANSLARDRELGVARLPLTRGVTRGAWVLATFVVLHLLAVVAVVGACLGSYVAAEGFYDFGPIAEDGFEIFSASEIRREVAIALVAATIPLISTIAVGLLVSLAAPTPAVAVAVAVTASLSFDVFKNLLGDAQRYVYASFQATLLDRSYLREVGQTARGFSDAGFTADEMWLNFVVPIPEATFALVLALGVVWWKKM